MIARSAIGPASEAPASVRRAVASLFGAAAGWLASPMPGALPIAPAAANDVPPPPRESASGAAPVPPPRCSAIGETPPPPGPVATAGVLHTALGAPTDATLATGAATSLWIAARRAF